MISSRFLLAWRRMPFNGAPSLVSVTSINSH
jgi:hypothetical protein